MVNVKRSVLGAGFASAVLLCVALPALAAGARLDAPAAVGELERLAAALDGSIGSEIARQFELAAVPAGAEMPAEGDARHRLLVSARLMQVLGVFALSGLLYLAMLSARGRLAGAIACLALAATPVILDQGHVLRPETASAIFAALGVVLLQCLAQAVYAGRTRARARRAVVLALLAVHAAIAFGFAVAVMPAMGSVLLVPIALFMLTTLQFVLRGLRISWRRTLFAWPAHAITRRLWAPALVALLSPVAALVCMRAALSVPYDRMQPSSLSASLLPASAAAASALLGLAILGGLAFVLRTGVRFGRRGRVAADLVVLVYVGTQIFHADGSSGGFDPLPAAPAFAVLVGEGALVVIGLVSWLRRVRGT